MQINNNIPSYQSPYIEQNKALQRVATTLAINQASDNPAASAIADVLKMQSNGYAQALSNTNTAIASLQIADGAMSEQSKILDQVTQKLIQASTDTTSQAGREVIMKDIQKMMSNFDDIARTTSFAGQTLLQKSKDDTDAVDSKAFLAGNTQNDNIQTSNIQSNSSGVGLSGIFGIDPKSFSAQDARGLLSQVANAQDTLDSFRGDIGSTQNQLESMGRNLIQQQIQTTEAQAVLTGANIPFEISTFNKQNVLSQVGAYVQSQSNTMQQNVLRLLA